MAFAHDRDLLALEPGLFAHTGWEGQTMAAGLCDITTGVLADSRADFASAGIDTGHTVVVGGSLTIEVLGRSSATSLNVSLLRPDESSAQLLPADATGVQYAVRSFRPQIEHAHRSLLQRLGLDTSQDSNPNADSVLNTSTVARAESLGAVAQTLFAAALGSSTNDPVWQRAMHYKERFAQAVRRLVVELDLDGDGTQDATRTAHTANLSRD